MDKRILVVIALIGIGLYALPATMSLFAGQHSFVNIDATGNQIDCVKCHGDVQAELQGGHSSVTGTNAPHSGFKCEYCHRIEAGSSSGDNAYEVVSYSVGSGATAGTRYLATDVMDMEAFNIPATINADSTTTQIKAMETESNTLFNSKGTMTVSPCYSGSPKVESTTGNCASGVVLTRGANNGIKLVSTYNPTTGTPKDTTASANMGLDLAKATSWTLTSRSAEVNLNGAGSRTVNPGTSYHAASLVSCMECHGGDEPVGHYSRIADGADASTGYGATPCANCHYSAISHTNQIYTLWAGGFGLTPDGQDTGATEAHMEFVRTDDGMTRQKDGASNGACVACHTHVATDISYDKPTTYGFNVDMTGGATEVLSGFTSN